MNTVAVIVVGIAWLLAILGGLGVGGLGKDSRRLDERAHGDDRAWRSCSPATPDAPAPASRCRRPAPRVGTP